ncbi:MAG: hypothetical protein M3Q88_04950 [Pseudomonadota bacterium]|nr:hypothetical protein [Pseudomonadota bacterium]
MHCTFARHWSVPALIAAFAQVVPAAACVPFAPMLALPDEPDEAYRLRSSSLLAAQYDEERRRWQQGLFNRAERVLIARVTGHPAGKDGDRWIAAQPLAAIKGELPAAPIAVQDRRMQSCAAVVGGERRRARAGDYIILFDATRFNEGDAPVAVEIAIHKARDPRLIDAIRGARLAPAELHRSRP